MSEPRSVLIVEDDLTTRYLFARALTQEGYAVHKARAYADAMSVIGGEDIDLILLDLRLPGRDGWQLLEAFREDPGARDLPIIIISAFLQDGDRVRALSSGCVDALEKPVDASTLVQRVRAAIGSPTSI
jgi:CheY-like chemotaxis protein